jgi:hypothetical protein
MARRSFPFGPDTLRLIEDARVDLLRALLDVRDDDGEPVFDWPASVPDLDDADAVLDYRGQLVEILNAYGSDELSPLEQRARRVCGLATGKGPVSLQTIVEQQLDHENIVIFEAQPDAMCRSLWIFLNMRSTFEDAESFHAVRQVREHRKLYDAFEVDLETDAPFDADAVDEDAFSGHLKSRLDLRPDVACTVRAFNLPATTTHPASVLVIIRHGGPLSSVFNHRNDGRRAPIYYRPPNEATLIYTPSMRQIEVCADSPVVRQKVGDAFAEVALSHDISQKPLTWKRYNLSRFRSSLSLDVPKIAGYQISKVRVLEAEVRLGQWRRKLSLKVAIEDDIAEVADRYLGARNVFRRAEKLSRTGIGVVYSLDGEATERTLNITISGTKSCNLQSHRDPEQRSLGFALLQHWGILSAFQQIDPSDLRGMFAALVQLHDRIEDKVSGSYLQELGLDPDQLISGGLLERCDRQDVILIDDGDIEGEAVVQPSAGRGLVRMIGPFGEEVGDSPLADFEMFAINAQWLHETLLQLLKPLLSKRSGQIVDPDLTLLGAMRIDGADVPVYFARRLNDLKTAERLDLALRARNMAGVGIILAASEDMPSHLGPNVVVPLLSHLASADDEALFSRDGVELAYRNGLSLARGGVSPRVVRTGAQSGTLFIPGKEPLHLTGHDQLTIFERLVVAAVKGSPDLQVQALMEGFEARSPQQSFRKATWDSIRDVYIGKGTKNGYWRLVLAVHPNDSCDALVEGPV